MGECHKRAQDLDRVVSLYDHWCEDFTPALHGCLSENFRTRDAHSWGVFKQMGYKARGNLKAHFLLLEYCNQGDIEHSIKSLEGAQKLDAVTQIAEGIQQLHSENIAHGDVYPRNIFANCEDAQVVYKLGDLGNAEQNGNLKDDMYQLCMLIQKLFDEKEASELNEDLFPGIANDPVLSEFFFSFCRTSNEQEGLTPETRQHIGELMPCIDDVVDELEARQLYD